MDTISKRGGGSTIWAEDNSRDKLRRKMSGGGGKSGGHLRERSYAGGFTDPGQGDS